MAEDGHDDHRERPHHHADGADQRDDLRLVDGIGRDTAEVHERRSFAQERHRQPVEKAEDRAPKEQHGGPVDTAPFRLRLGLGGLLQEAHNGRHCATTISTTNWSWD